MTPPRWRLLAAFAILPVIQALVAFFSFPLVWQLGQHGNVRPVDENQAARSFALLTGFLGGLVTVAGAIPIVFTLVRRGRLSFVQLLLVGLFLGNAPFAVFVFGFVLPATAFHLVSGTMSEHLVPVSQLLLGTLRALAIGSTFGVMSAAAFWVIGVWPTSTR